MTNFDSLFEDPEVKEDDVILPNSELEDAEIITEQKEEEKEPTDFNAIYENAFMSEVDSTEFNNSVQETINFWKLSGDMGIIRQGKAEALWNKETNLFNIDLFKNEKARASAIIFNDAILAEKQKYQDALAPYTKVAQPGEEVEFTETGDTTLYKYEFTDEGSIEYFYRKSANDNWIKQEDEVGAWSIQTRFKQNESTEEDITNYFLKKEEYEKWQNFENSIYDIDTALKNKQKYIKQGLFAEASDLNEESKNVLDPTYDVGGEDIMFIPQDYETPTSWDYEGEGGSNYLDNVIEALGIDPKNKLDIFNIILNNGEGINPNQLLSSTAANPINTSVLGVKINSFLGWVEKNKETTGGLDALIENHVRSIKNKENPWVSFYKGEIGIDTEQDGMTAFSEGKNVELMNRYMEEEESKNTVFLITNYFANNVDKYIKEIKEVNTSLEKFMQVTAGPFAGTPGIKKIGWDNWMHSEKIRGLVLNDMASDLGIEKEEIVSYLANQVLFDRSKFQDYQKNNFNDYYRYNEKIKNEASKRNVQIAAGKSKGEVLEDGFFSNFGRGIADKVSNFSLFARDIINGVNGSWLGGEDIFNTRDIYISNIVRDQKEAALNLRSSGRATGVTAIGPDGVKYLLNEDGIIYRFDTASRFVPENTDEGGELYRNIFKALKESENVEVMSSWSDKSAMFGHIGGNLFFDVIGTFGTRWGANKTGLTKKFNKLLKNKFSLNPAKVNLYSNTLNTMGYYTAAGAADGYVNIYQAAIAAGNISEEEARELAALGSGLQGAWWALGSIFVPQSIYDKIPWAVGGFRNVTKSSINAYQKGGMNAYTSFWRNHFTKLNPTSQAVVSKFKNAVYAAGGETIQEEFQEGGQQEIINTYLNSVVGQKLLDDNFTFDEVINTAIYSAGAGGGMGLLATGGINTNSQQYLENLLYLGKTPDKLKNLLNSMVASSELNAETANKFFNDAISVRNQSFKLPTFVKTSNVIEVSNLLQKIDDLNNSKKQIANEFHGAIDVQIEDIKTDLSLLYTSELNMGNQIIADQLGFEYIEGDTNKIESTIEQLLKEDPNANVDRSIGFGAFVTANGKQYSLVDTQKSSQKGYFTTGQHEGFHGLVSALIRRDPSAGGRLGKALLKEIRKGISDGRITLKNNELGMRFQQYVSDTKLNDEVVLEELMPLLSEALTRNGVVFNEDVGTKIGDAYRRTLAAFGINRSFKKGSDVLNLVRDYNKAVESKKGLSRGLRKIGEGKASIKIDEDTTITDSDGVVIDRTGETISLDKRSSKDLDTLISEFKSGDSDVDVESLTKQYQNLGRDALKRWAAQRGVTINLGNPQIAEEVTSLLNKEFNSFMKNFDSSKASVSTYMNNIAKRIGPVLVEEGTRRGKQVSQDVLSEKGVSLETTTQPDIDKKSEVSGARAKVFPNSVKVIADNVTGEIRAEQIVFLKNDITEAILRVGTNPKNVAKFVVEKTKSKEYRAILKKALGPFASEQYIDNVNKLFNNTQFIKSIPVANIKRRFGKLFGIKQTGTTPTIKIENGKRTDFNKQVYSIPAITDSKLNKVKQYFLASEKRHQSLMSLIGEGIAVEAINEIANDKDFMDNLQNRLEFRDSDLTASQFMNELEFNLDKRNLETKSLDSVKLSKDTEPLTQEDIQRIGLIVESSPKDLLRQKGYKTYPSTKANWSDSFSAEQKKQRNNAVIRMLPKLGLDYFNSYAWFKHNKSIFKDAADFKNEIFDKALDVDFVKNNKTFVDKYATKKGNQYFLNKNSLPKQGSALTKTQWKVLKKARTEQATYAKMTPSKRTELLKDPDFRKLQENKTNVLEKIVKTINSDIRDSDGNIISERLEFWAAWMESQNNVPSHDFRVLAPIKFFSLSTLPFTTPVLKVRNKDNTITEGALKNYEAEHMLPVNNATRAILNMVIDGNIDKDFQFIKDNYVQGQLLKADDNIITRAGYQTRLPRDFFNMDKPNSWVRYLLGNPKIDLNSYVTFKDGKVMTVAESLGLPLLKIDQNPDSINAQNELLIEVLKGDKTIADAQVELKKSEKVNKTSSKQVIINQETLFPLLNKDGDTESSIKAFNDADETNSRANRYSKEPKGISVFDFDDTLAFSDSKVIVKLADGKITKITPEQFANQAEQLQQDGAVFDFTEFNKVVNGKKGPLADLALKRQKKFGSGDIFVLTARPQLSAPAIKMFLDGIGLNIPIENITGLENGSPEAKALWILDKTAQGYNDFYFADDVLANVQAVKNILDQVDVKSKVQQAKASKEVDLDKEFNVIIEQQSGKDWFKTYSNARATVEGKKANRFEFFIPPSAEDFVGLMYKILPKGEKGNLAMRWINDNLLDPFNKAEQNVISAKMSVANDFKSLRDSINDIPKNLMNQSGYSNFTWSQALRVYIWNMQNDTVPGLSNRDKNALVKLIENNPSMKVFAEKIAFIQKGKSYPSPRDTWVGGSITSDIIDGIQKVYRKEALAEWQQNVDIIFSKKNMNKLEALYGSNFTFALKNMLGRMKRGSNRSPGGNPQVDNVIDWVNNSVGTTMFLNRKSALLQLISNVNYLNWSDNNIIEAGKAFANQKQYWTDVSYLLNSDYLVQRRNGLKINVAESEIAEASKKGGFKGVVAMLLNKGFVFTRFADSLAIATGGATFYRNRLSKLQTKVNPDTGKLYTKKQAEAVAFNDFYKISEETQQSSRTDRISMQQASGLGRIILNYANTPMQYARIIKKATKDLLAGRGDAKTNISKIVYYGAVQNLIFNSLQQALFALAFAEDDEDPKQDRTVSDKATNIGFGMLSSLLRGLGYGGALVDTLISVSKEISWGKDGLPVISEDAVFNIADFSPTIDTKIRKFRAIQKTFRYNRKEIKRRGFSIENPAYYAFAQVIDAGFNIPLDRALRMVMTIKQASDRDTQLWQRFALVAGFSSWSLGLPYWGTTTTVGEEAAEDEAIKVNYKKESTKLKNIGYKRIPMTRGKPEGKLNEDFIEVTRPSGDTEYWLIPKMKIK